MTDTTSVKVGDRLYADGQKQPYVVKARDERFIIATKPFNLRRTVLYFIIDLLNGVRGPDDRLFCSGYETQEQINKRLNELQEGDIAVSRRRSVSTVEVDCISPPLDDGKFRN